MFKGKYIFSIFIVLLVLITSVGFIAASDDSSHVTVKVIWDDKGVQLPDSVTVDLIKDGKVVDTAKLSKANSWKTTFDIDDNGIYSVKQSNLNDFDTKIMGNVNSGFEIKNTAIKEVLGAVADEPVSDDATNELVADDGDSAQGEPSQNEPVAANDTSDKNSSDSNNTDKNTDDDKNSNNDTEKVKKVVKSKTVTKVIKQEPKKKPVKHNVTDHKKTGFPLVVLVIAVFVAIFVPITRKK